MGNPINFSVGAVDFFSDLRQLFFEHFEDIKIHLFLLKQIIQLFLEPFLKSVKRSVFLQELFCKNHVFLVFLRKNLYVFVGFQGIFHFLKTLFLKTECIFRWGFWSFLPYFSQNNRFRLNMWILGHTYWCVRWSSASVRLVLEKN